MNTALFRPVGKHLLADLYGVLPHRLTDAGIIESLLLDSARAAGARILFSHFHSFGPGQGITGVVLLAESHISIHTWPEFGFVAADIFMCGAAEPQRALDVIQTALEPTSCTLRTVPRGHGDDWNAAPATP